MINVGREEGLVRTLEPTLFGHDRVKIEEGSSGLSLCGVHAVEECEDLLDRHEMAAGVEHVPAPAVERRVGDAQRDEVDDVIAERGVVPQQLPS